MSFATEYLFRVVLTLFILLLNAYIHFSFFCGTALILIFNLNWVKGFRVLD